MNFSNINNNQFNINKLNVRYCNSDNDFKNYISYSLANYLQVIKEELVNYETSWDVYKKYTNVYEYIHTNVPMQKYSISKFKPLSRAFFKFIEIVHRYKLVENYNETNIKTFHLAEGPGGFIQAISHIRKNSNDKYYGMTLINEQNKNIPGWKKSERFLNENKNVFIERGRDKTGDLLNHTNLQHNYDKYKNSMNIITGDGGFDFSSDFNKQEVHSSLLILGQIFHALILQKRGGSFVLKIFDIFHKITIDCIYLLTYFYENIEICKPQTSRTGNSEKYIICKNFKYNDTTFLLEKFKEILKNAKGRYVTSIIKDNISLYFLNKIEDVNINYGFKQINVIQNTINLINNKNIEKINTMINNNVIQCITWCKTHELEYNNFTNLN